MSADRDLRARVVWACPALTLAQRALYDLIRRLERGGEGAVATADFLAQCLASTERTIATDRWDLHRLGLLKVRQENRRQAGTWICTLPKACIPLNSTHNEIMRCAGRLTAHVRLHPTEKSESSPGGEVSVPESSPESSPLSEPRVHPTVNTTTECITQRDTEDSVRAGGARLGARPAAPTPADTEATIATLEAQAAAATNPFELKILERTIALKRRRLHGGVPSTLTQVVPIVFGAPEQLSSALSPDQVTARVPGVRDDDPGQAERQAPREGV